MLARILSSGIHMINLVTLAKRITQSKRQLDHEAHLLAVRLEKLDKAATLALQNAHLILDEQQRNVAALEQMNQQLMNQQLTAIGSEEAGDAPSDNGKAQPENLDAQQQNVIEIEQMIQQLTTPSSTTRPNGNSQDAGMIKNTIQKMVNFRSAAQRGNAA
jgi:hypothetical protein